MVDKKYMTQTIRRNAHKKIRSLVAKAIEVRTYDHSGPEAPKTVAPEDVDAVLAMWFDWSKQCGSAWISESTRYGKGGSGDLRRQTILTLAYHQNQGIDVILSDAPAT